MGDWRTEAGLTRFPEDNSVIGVPIDAVRRTMTDDEVTQHRLLMIEIFESDDFKFAQLVGMGGLIIAKSRRRFES